MELWLKPPPLYWPILKVKMFGGYTRWHADLPAPTDAVPARSLLSSVDHAVRAAAAAPRPGPVHLNCQFREPLAPVAAGWSAACLQVRERGLPGGPSTRLWASWDGLC